MCTCEFDAVVAVLSRRLVIRFRVVEQYKVVSRVTLFCSWMLLSYSLVVVLVCNLLCDASTSCVRQWCITVGVLHWLAAAFPVASVWFTCKTSVATATSECASYCNEPAFVHVHILQWQSDMRISEQATFVSFRIILAAWPVASILVPCHCWP